MIDMQGDQFFIKKRRILVEIPEKDLRDMFGWLRQRMDEWAVRTYLLKHLEAFDEGLELSNFVGFNIYFMGKEEIDMLFKKNGVYYLVETKQKAKYYKGWKQLAATVDCFLIDMKEHGEHPKEIVAILATSSIERVDKLKVQKLDWFTREELENLEEI
jgi:hypothetical protein